jgi:hypothetical protein
MEHDDSLREFAHCVSKETKTLYHWKSLLRTIGKHGLKWNPSEYEFSESQEYIAYILPSRILAIVVENENRGAEERSGLYCR